MSMSKGLQARNLYVSMIAVAVFTVAILSVAVPTSQAAAPCYDKVYGNGNADSCVAYIQSLANHKLKYYSGSPTLGVDGKYGPKTVAGVKTIQKVFGLSQDGIVGIHTWNALCTPDINKSASSWKGLSASEFKAWTNAGCEALTGI